MSRMHPDDRAAAYAELSSNMQEGGHKSVSRLILPSGRVRVVESRTTTQRDATGGIVMVVGSVMDITERFERERQLLESRKLAQQNADQQTVEGANLSHEIRTPLMSIVGYAYLLQRRDDLTADAREEAKAVVRSSETLLTIANSVLGQSRATAALNLSDLAPVRIRSVVENAANLFDAQITSKGIAFSCEIDDSVPAEVNTHGGALMQVLVNLLGNAAKFTHAGSIAVTVAFDAANARLSLCVRDTGQGFDDRTREALFQRFSRGSEEHRLPSGAGLGLAICKGLVEALRGTISATSNPGEGSVFTVDIPAKASPALEEVSIAARRASSILIVDDHPAMREIASRVLEAAGAQVALAVDGHSALELALSTSFDLILIDLNLPDMSGTDIAALIRSQVGPNANTRLVAFTAADIDSRYPPANFDACLQKPVHPADLAALVR